jgi:hypothetical protein
VKIGKRTAKLLREAIVLAHVEGAFWAGYTPTEDNPYLKDSVVVANVLRSARSNRDTFPTLGRVETEEHQ